MRKSREEQSKETKERILTAAVKMMGETGYDKFALNAFCKEHHISKGLFYHYFSGKEELFLDCVEICYSELLRFLRVDSNVPSIRRYAEQRVGFFKEHPALARIFFESLVQTKEPLRSKVQAIRERLLEFNRKVFLQFISGAKLKKGVSEKEAMAYFELIQRMINAYYGSPMASLYGPEGLEQEHHAELEKFLEFILFGVAESEEQEI